MPIKKIVKNKKLTKKDIFKVGCNCGNKNKSPQKTASIFCFARFRLYLRFVKMIVASFLIFMLCIVLLINASQIDGLASWSD